MTTKRRMALLVLLVVALLSGLAGGVAWYLRGRPASILGRGEFALAKRNLDKAKRLARQYVSKYPDHWQGHFLLGRVLAAEGRFEDARREMAEALERDPGNTEVAFALAETYGRAARTLLEQQGGRPTDLVRIDQAIQSMMKGHRLLSEPPQDPALLAKQAEVTVAAGQMARAMDLYRKAWLVGRNAVVANNAASLSARLYADQPARPLQPAKPSTGLAGQKR